MVEAEAYNRLARNSFQIISEHVSKLAIPPVSYSFSDGGFYFAKVSHGYAVKKHMM